MSLVITVNTLQLHLQFTQYTITVYSVYNYSYVSELHID